LPLANGLLVNRRRRDLHDVGRRHLARRFPAKRLASRAHAILFSDDRDRRDVFCHFVDLPPWLSARNHTTLESHDTASNLYDFPAREYGIQGRWASPDPAGLSAVNPLVPQSWNRYAYTQNSPMNAIDPTGTVTMMCKDKETCLFNFVGGGGGPICTADGADIPCWMAHDMLGSGAAVQCPNNNCGIGTSTPYRCIDAVCGYMSNEYASTHASNWDGRLYSDSEWATFLKNRRDAIQEALADKMSWASNSLDGSNWNTIYDNLNYIGTTGGNANFLYNGIVVTLGFSFPLGDTGSGCEWSCRDGSMPSLHYNNSMFHLDTANPSWGFEWGLFVHGGVDFLLGHINPSVPMLH
jgi:RHS repeat-associated protein